MHIIIWLILGGFAAVIAEGKGYNSMIWGVAGIFFGVFALIAIILLPSNNKTTSKEKENDS